MTRMQAPNVPPSAELGFRAQMRTRWADEDNQSVLNNAVFLTLFEEARYHYFASLDLLDGKRFSFLLAQTNIVFLRPGRGACDVEVEMATTHLGKSSFTQVFRVLGPDGETWCEAQARMVSVDRDGAPRDMPAEFRSAIAAREGIGQD
jgi:acyl-CoA thioesterase FadM